MKLSFGERPRVFNDAELARIFDASVRVFQSVTATIDAPDEVLQPLLELGCDVSGKQVKFPVGVVDTVLDRLGVFKAENDASAEPVADYMSYSASGQAMTWHDPHTDELRPATCADQAVFSRLCDHLDLSRAHPTILCTDVPPMVRDIWTFGTVVLNSRKPWIVSVYSKESVEYFLRILEAALGHDDAIAAGKDCVGAKVWINTPFMMARDCFDYALEYRRIFGQPLGFTAMPVMGAATPATVAGCAVQSLAECYVANVVSLAVDDRVVGNVANPLGFDMRYGVHVESGPDAYLIRTAHVDAASYAFGGNLTPPCVPSTMAKKPGAQSMFEKCMGTMLGVMSGGRSCGCLGRLAAGDIGSPVQLLMDLEMMHAVDFLLRDVVVDSDHLAEDVIMRTVPKGARYMEDEHTLTHFREESWAHALLDRRLPDAWLKDPDTMVEKARKEAMRLMDEAPNHCPSSDEQLKTITAIMEEATRELAG